ncbi:MAG: hypothetical protein IAG13_04485 [Deltaproteobacteria bacterium]|nr:hypothetical protein [Nannocystaceae bacterium]
MLLQAAHEARTRGLDTVLVAGWTSAGGSEDEALGGARADALLALVQNDRMAWTKLAADRGSLADILAYLDYLHRERGFECEVAAISPAPSSASERSLTAFQQLYNLRFGGAIAEDGVCGEETLGAVFDVMRFEWDRWLEKYGSSQAEVEALDWVALDASSIERSEPLAVTETEGGADIVLIDSSAFGGRGADAALVYGSRVARTDRFDIVAEPGGWQTGRYTLITDVAPGEEMLPEIYTLRASDGSWAQSRMLPDEAVADVLLELRFDDVPCDRSFRLDVEIAGESTYNIFSDVPYGGLHAYAPGPQRQGESR